MFVPSLYSFNFRISNLYIYLNFIAFSVRLDKELPSFKIFWNQAILEKSRRILRKNSFYVDLFGWLENINETQVSIECNSKWSRKSLSLFCFWNQEYPLMDILRFCIILFRPPFLILDLIFSNETVSEFSNFVWTHWCITT